MFDFFITPHNEFKSIAGGSTFGVNHLYQVRYKAALLRAHQSMPDSKAYLAALMHADIDLHPH